ncbi:hypothetical protein D3C80_1765260 [compost metagenome]
MRPHLLQISLVIYAVIIAGYSLLNFRIEDRKPVRQNAHGTHQAHFFDKILLRLQLLISAWSRTDIAHFADARVSAYNDRHNR